MKHLKFILVTLIFFSVSFSFSQDKMTPELLWKLKRVGGVVVCAILGCLVGVILRNPFVYMACFGVLVGCILFALLMLVMQLMGRILPKNLEQAYRRRKNRLTVIIFSAVLLYFFGYGQ